MGGKCIDITGEKYGSLTVIKRTGTDPNTRQSLWLCKCDCGKEVVVRSNGLRSGNTKTCGCGVGFKEKEKNPNYKNGQSQTRLYHIWTGMKSRCFNKKHTSYHNYGGRGITVCREWEDNFTAFYDWALKNGYKENLTLDRIDVNGNYEPSNCRWATRQQQSCNTRRNIPITIDGESHLLLEWAEIFGINRYTMLNRYYRSGRRGKDLLKPVNHTKTG